MEHKYGIGIGKKRKSKNDDFADIGMGYDESDSFIDNTDGYDEIIPKNVTTVHGGFYINCGALEFKVDEGATTDASSSSEDDTPEKSLNRKRILESSAASEDEMPPDDKTELPEKKQKIILGTNAMQKAIKKRLFRHDKIKQIRKKMNNTTESKKTVRDLLKERRVDLDMTTTELDQIVELKDIVLPSNDNRKSADTVDYVIESVINSVIKEDKDVNGIDVNKDSNYQDIVLSTARTRSPEDDSSDGMVNVVSSELVQLPENLPSDIVEIIDSMKKAAACSTEGKVKFFAGNVNVLLLNLERKCKCLGRNSRNKVYEHLAPFVKCRKETLMKRAKNLIVVEEKKKIKFLIDKLKAVVGQVMPTIAQNYEEECKAVLQKKFSAQDEANKSLRMPKRHFQWDDHSKKLVKDIIILRKKCFLNEGKQKDSLEENLISFLKSEVQILWPDGWMSINTLMKYSNLIKDKKILDSSKKSSSNSLPNIKDIPQSGTSNISVNTSSGLTITPVTTNVEKSPLEVKSKPVASSETIITRVSNVNNTSNKSISVLPLTPPDGIKNPQPEHNSVVYNTLTTILPVEEPRIQKLVSNVEIPINAAENMQKEIIVIDEESIKADENMEKDEIVNKKVETAHTSVITQETTSNKLSSNSSIIDLTDLPELIRKPGPKSKTKYYTDSADNVINFKKEPSKLEGEQSGSLVNYNITESLSLELNKVAQTTIHNSNSNTNHGNSVLKKHTYDYSKPKVLHDYSKIKSLANDLSKVDYSKMKSSTNDMSKVDYSKMKSSANDMTKVDYSKMKSSANDMTKVDYSKMKSSANDMTKVDYSKMKSSTNDMSRIDYTQMRSSATDLSQIDYIKRKSSTNEMSRVDYSKKKPSANDLPKIDYSNMKSSTSDMSKMEYNKTKSSSNDLSKIKSPILLNDYNRNSEHSKSSEYNKSHEHSKSSEYKKRTDYHKSKSVSEGEDIQKVMEGLIVLQKMSSPIKPKEDAKSSSAVPVINYNKGYSLESMHSLPASLTSATNNVANKNNTFQDAFQKQFIKNFDLMKASQSLSSKGNHNSIPKYNNSSNKSNSTSNDRYLQNSNHIYPQQSPTNKLKSISSSSPQTANSKPSTTHQN